MDRIPRKIVTDEANRPIAVLIDYVDWLEIERRLAGLPDQTNKPAGLERFAGVVKLHEDPMEYQRRVRGEWQ